MASTVSEVGIVIAVVLVGLVVILIAVVVGLFMRRKARTTAPAAPARPLPEPTAPMLGLETALDQATDRSGRPVREKFESGSIDDLRVVDDTGPVLRRALDQVESTHVESAQVESAQIESTRVEQTVSDDPPTAPSA
jgi:hypothetical protein